MKKFIISQKESMAKTLPINKQDGFISVAILLLLMGSLFVWQGTQFLGSSFRASVREEMSYTSCLYGAEEGMMAGILQLRKMTMRDIKAEFLKRNNEMVLDDDRFSSIKVSYKKENTGIYEVHSVCAAKNGNIYVGVRAQLEIIAEEDEKTPQVKITRVIRL